MSSRARHNKNQNCGRDYWGNRPFSWRQISYPKHGGKFHKKRTHKAERRQGRADAGSPPGDGPRRIEP